MKITASGTRLSGVDKAFDFRGVHVASSCLSRCLDRGMVAEIKRMFVSPAARGNNIGRLLLQKLQAVAIERGINVLRLETGIKQPEALALYRSAGFVEIGPFAHYRPDELSVFMEKTL